MLTKRVVEISYNEQVNGQHGGFSLIEVPEDQVESCVSKLKQQVEDFLLANDVQATYVPDGRGFIYIERDTLNVFSVHVSNVHEEQVLTLEERFEEVLSDFFNIKNPATLLHKVDHQDNEDLHDDFCYEDEYGGLQVL